MHMPRFPDVDFLDFDSLLNDEEKLARQTARQFVDDLVLPIIEQYNREGKFPAQARAANGGARFFRSQPERLRLRRHVERAIRPRDAGNRGRRFVAAELRFRAIGSRDVSDSRVWVRRPKAKMASLIAAGQSDRLLWIQIGRRVSCGLRDAELFLQECGVRFANEQAFRETQKAQHSATVLITTGVPGPPHFCSI
jgi:hypothetical protein